MTGVSILFMLRRRRLDGDRWVYRAVKYLFQPHGIDYTDTFILRVHRYIQHNHAAVRACILPVHLLF